VIEGDTDHYAHVAHRASEGLMRVQIDTGIPIAFGILTVRDIADAEIRSVAGPDNKGREAAHAAVMTALTLKAIG
jgi:6,7-dimethyl-8-ribityllumazine synthase